jgi:hypothetical protein
VRDRSPAQLVFSAAAARKSTEADQECVPDRSCFDCDLAHTEWERSELNKGSNSHHEATPMLAEKFILLLETLKSHAYADGSPRVVSTSPHVPMKLAGGPGREPEPRALSGMAH